VLVVHPIICGIAGYLLGTLAILQ